jgi:hypothetical protein
VAKVTLEGRLHSLGPWGRVIIEASDRVRRGRRDRNSGPFLITGVASRLALNTGQQGQGCRVASGLPDSLSHQLWHLRPTGVRGEFSIMSAVAMSTPFGHGHRRGCGSAQRLRDLDSVDALHWG